jgi:hypothetical protein
LFPLLLALTKRRPHLVELGLAGLWFHFALTGFRYVPLWVVVAVPLLARASLKVPWLQQQARRLVPTEEGRRSFFVSPRCSPWLFSVLGALALPGLARGAEGRFARHQPEIIPAKALDRFLQIHTPWSRQHGRRPVVFHSTTGAAT